MKEYFLDQKIDVIATLMLLTAALLLPSIPVKAEKCPRFTDEKCFTETSFRPGTDIIKEGLTYRARDVGEKIGRNSVTYTHSVPILVLVFLICLSPLTLRAREKIRSRG